VEYKLDEWLFVINFQDKKFRKLENKIISYDFCTAAAPEEAFCVPVSSTLVLGCFGGNFCIFTVVRGLAKRKASVKFFDKN